MKRLFSILLAVCLLIPMLMVPASAAVDRPDLTSRFEPVYKQAIALGEPAFSYDTFLVAHSFISGVSQVRVLYYNSSTREMALIISNNPGLAKWTSEYSIVSSISVMEFQGGGYYLSINNPSPSVPGGGFAFDYLVDNVSINIPSYITSSVPSNMIVNIPVTIIDTSVLEALISQARAIQDDGYRVSTWTALQNATTASQSLLDSRDYTQDRIDAQVTYLQAAINGLELLPTTPDLPTLLAHALTIENVGYTMYSWSAFQAATNNAETLLSGRDYTQGQFTSAYVRLENSIDALALDVPDPGGGDHRYLRDGLTVSDLMPYQDAIMQNMNFSVRNGIILFAVLFGIWFSVKVLNFLFANIRNSSFIDASEPGMYGYSRSEVRQMARERREKEGKTKKRGGK